MAAKRKSSKLKPKKLEAGSFVQVVADGGADERIEIEVDGAVVRLHPGFDPADFACVLEVLGRR